MFVNLRPSYKRSPQMNALIATNLGMVGNPYLVGLQIDQKRLRNCMAHVLHVLFTVRLR